MDILIRSFDPTITVLGISGAIIVALLLLLIYKLISYIFRKEKRPDIKKDLKYIIIVFLISCVILVLSSLAILSDIGTGLRNAIQ